MATMAPQLGLILNPQTDLDALFARQRAHAPAMRRTTVAERRARLSRLRRTIVARRAEIAEALYADLRRPAAEAEITEIFPALAEIDYTSKHLGKWMRPQRAGFELLLAGTSSSVVYQPLGVALIMAPWNYPFILLVQPLISAVAAGNCAVCKPSEKSPATSRMLAALLTEAFDPAEVAVVEGGADTAQALLKLPFDHIFFTGGTAVGKIVMAAAANHLASVTLELGGKSPAVVDQTADVAAAAERVALGKFMNAGQTCVAPDYAFVHRSQQPAFLEALRNTLTRFYGPDAAAWRASPDYARIIDAGHYARLTDMLDRSVKAGARIVAGGDRDPVSRYIAPTVLADVTPQMPVMEGEIFGPILPVMTWDHPDEVVNHVRRTGKPLAMYVFTRDRRAAQALVRDTSAGMTAINNIAMFYFHHRLPFGGVGDSGLGGYHGEYGFRTFSHPRPVLRQHEPALVRLFFPPYRGRLHALAQRVLRILE